MLDNDDFVNEVFPALIDPLKHKEAQDLLTVEQKRQILIAMGTSVEQVENGVTINYFNFTMTVTEDGQVSIGFKV
jgi:hypothetical protein